MVWGTLDEALESAHARARDVYGPGVAIELFESPAAVSAKVWSRDGRAVLLVVREKTKRQAVDVLYEELVEREGGLK